MPSTCDLAYEILKKAKKPMHYREITKEILKRKEILRVNP